MNRIVVAIWLVFVTAGLTDCGKRSLSVSEQRDREERELQRKVIEFTENHNAITDWNKGFPHGLATMAYTFQVEDALVRADKRPVAAKAYLRDIVRRDGRTFLEFSNVDGLHFTLEAETETVQQVLKESPINFLNEYELIAEVQSVQENTIESSRTDGADAQSQTPGSLHVMGRCTGLLKLHGPRGQN